MSPIAWHEEEAILQSHFCGSTQGRLWAHMPRDPLLARKHPRWYLLTSVAQWPHFFVGKPIYYQYIDLKLYTRSSSVPVGPQTVPPSLQEGEHLCFGCKKEVAEKNIFLYENLPLLLIQDHKSWERWLQKDSIAPNRLQTRACNTMPKTAPLFSGNHTLFLSGAALHQPLTVA